MIYKWLTPIQPNQIKSVFGKTVMFWVCEANHKNDRTFWKEAYKSVLRFLRELFHRMMKYFEYDLSQKSTLLNQSQLKQETKSSKRLGQFYKTLNIIYQHHQILSQQTLK